jgi:ankyrin repeat protein
VPESHGIDDDTPLHVAAFNNDVELLKGLMPFVTNIDVLGDIGLTPMANAVINEGFEAVVYLLSCGADPMILDEVGDSVLEIMKRRPVFNELVEQIESGRRGRFEVDEVWVMERA